MQANNRQMRCVDGALRRASLRWNLALFAVGAVWVVALGNPAEPLERRWFDQALVWRTAAGQTPAADPRIVILGIDDTDIAGLSSLESEYSAAAQYIRDASELGAAAVVLDIIHLRGSETMAKPLLDEISAGSPVVLAEALQPVPGENSPGRRIRSFPFLAARPSPAGIINITADADGIHRIYKLLYGSSSLEPSLALAAYFAARGIDWNSDVKQPSPGQLLWPELSADGSKLEERRLATAPGTVRLLNFRNSWEKGAGFGHLTLRGLHALHSAEAGKGGTPLAGKIVFVAHVSTGIADVGPTPFGANEPLVLLHATALNDLLQGRSILRAPRWADALAFLLIPLLGQCAALCSRKRWLLTLWLLGLAGIVATGLALLLVAGVLVATISTAVLWTLALVLEVARRHSHEFAARQHLRSSVGAYFSPRVLEDVLSNPGCLEPKRVEITVLLTDLRNSTPLAEILGTEGMLALLNRVFEIENRAVFAKDGSLEKPVGDQFLAYWGAPDPHDAAERALQAAIELIAGLEALRATLDPPVRELFGYGVAVHAGPSLIANIGSAQFFHYGVVGDLINATARIEALTKTYGVRALITREVLEKLPAPPPPSRLLDRVIVKGKSVPLELHEVAHSHNAGSFDTLRSAYAEAFNCYQQGAFTAAATLFAALAPLDGPSRLLAERCTALAKDPPKDWHGVYKFDSK